MIVYENNEVIIEIQPVDIFEAKVNINGQNLIWMERNQTTNFQKELTELLDKYRI